MALSKFQILLCIPVLFGVSRASAAELTKLSTKQSINNLRFISRDGKFTYFQRRSGGLLLSTNYKAVEVVKGSLGSQYTMVSSNSRKKLIISQDPYFHNFYGIRHNLRLYQIDYGGVDSKEIGVGLNPMLHLEDNWASFYDSHLKSIFYRNLNSDSLSFKVLLGNSLNPYFIPQTVMVSEDQIIFTDINGQGIPGVILFNRKNNSLTPFYKSLTYNSKVEICSNDTHLFIGIFGLNRSSRSSTIIKYDKKNLVAEKGESIYTSNRNDFGQMICNFDNESIYFIKNFSSDKKDKFEVAELKISNKEVKNLSNVGMVTSVIQMDGLLLLPFRGDYFIVKGNADLVNDSILVNPKIPAPVELKIPVANQPTQASPTATATPTPMPSQTVTPAANATGTPPASEKIIKPELPGLK